MGLKERRIAALISAHNDVKAARAAYRRAVLAAYDAEIPVATIASKAGMSRQNVYGLIWRHRKAAERPSTPAATALSPHPLQGARRPR